MNQRSAQHRRQAGLDRLSRTTRWVVAGAVASVPLFTAVVAKAIPGHTPRSSSTATPHQPTPSSSASALQPPAQAPVSPPATNAPQVVSGGS